MTGLLGQVLAPDPPPFALLYRPESTGEGTLDVLVGDVRAYETLADIPLPSGPHGEARHDALVLVPYRQIAERGFIGTEDGSPLLAMTVTGQETRTVAEVLRRIPDTPIGLTGGGFDIDDETYAETVRRVVTEEIGTGKGANFVIKRSYSADITDYGPGAALTFFRRLLERESGAYWTFVVHTGDRTFVGATPERHVSLTAGLAVMNPISGTYRYAASGPTLPAMMEFLADRKEIDELYMVVDEELKMMSRICPEGGRVIGPFLKEMARLAHTEYFIEGHSDRDPRDILRETMFAPTVTGSPLESACRVINQYEPEGRGYYSGVVALLGRDHDGGHALDSSILIRTADIDAGGRLRIGVGATLVRHSDPMSEAAETRAKAAGLLAALETGGQVRLSANPEVRAALAERNSSLADFWLAHAGDRHAPDAYLAGRRLLVVDAEDTFTSMIAQQLSCLGLTVTVRRFDEPYDPADHDLTVMGPGPGDPRDLTDPKIAHLDAAVARLLATRTPFLAVCLSHQVLSRRLGLPLIRREVPNQGVQREIDLFGRRERVGFYNTFAAVSDEEKFDSPDVGPVEVSRSTRTGEVHGLRGPWFASTQFHAESVLTRDGVHITRNLLTELLRRTEGAAG
ncbi:phenazine-specific anthranilate synthase component I [Streptomyces microflavus]|uniref:anthranilate synthase n=2 Tax=Streptomyces microflavus TaxID=1919 RepID=N0CTI1_STRMI|nr:phenazine-specific anthranilate synthase component I [Streptomyces microflavus]AGK78254.1 PhzE [Streptomyces microflavus DSM 40593]WSS35627.1 phenazine-specific anthranilate synthase component I [Streptomyces microflavus]WST15807.1 phenazine-specific anthranilate synthase component I [Streptomyces microflavus]